MSEGAKADDDAYTDEDHAQYHDDGEQGAEELQPLLVGDARRQQDAQQ